MTVTVPFFARASRNGAYPFVIYSGHENVEGACKGAPHVTKPASNQVLLAAVEDLIRGAQNSN